MSQVKWKSTYLIAKRPTLETTYYGARVVFYLRKKIKYTILTPYPLLTSNLTSMGAKQKAAFDSKFLETIKASLEDQKKRLSLELQKSGDDSEATFPKYGDEEDDNAREVADFTTNKPLEMTMEKTLLDIDKALSRIQKGNYGICKYCDQQIAEKRLLARPTSSACVSCKKTLTDEV